MSWIFATSCSASASSPLSRLAPREAAEPVAADPVTTEPVFTGKYN
ncbi:MAG: hypothetical protein R3D84_08745 [Paracoccaceae bacterium]